ncbi:MAG: ABC transporter ATP-binding protein [Bacteroidota bacterium]
MLKAEKLRKQFTTVLAVDDVSLEVRRGGIFGLIGPNGAGKSTTIRMLLNITKPDSGTIVYDGAPFSTSIRNTIGYLPEERGLYKKNGVLDTIIYFASLRGIERNEAKRRGEEWLERFNLHSYAKRKVEELSKGNQQKAQFITSILHDPEMIVLDEPFSGLDPVNQIVMKDILKELKQRNKAVIFSTHQMETAEKLCDEICLINRGRVVLEGTVKQVKQQFGSNALHLEYNGDGAFLADLPFVAKATVYENFAELSLKDSVSGNDVLSSVSDKLEIRKLEFVEPSLNSIFLEVVGATVEQIEQDKIESGPDRPAIRKTDPEVKKQRLLLIAGLIVTFIGIALSLGGKDTWSLAGVGGVISVAAFLRLRKAMNRVSTEARHE